MTIIQRILSMPTSGDSPDGVFPHQEYPQDGQMDQTVGKRKRPARKRVGGKRTYIGVTDGFVPRVYRSVLEARD